jgi:hypothetical protein
MAFFFCAGAMADAFRDDYALAFVHGHTVAVFKVQNKRATPTEEHLVLMLMRMKRIFAFDLGEFEFLSVQRGNGFGSPMLGELREFLIYVDGLVQFISSNCHPARSAAEMRDLSVANPRLGNFR